jgi:hypothetical protein
MIMESVKVNSHQRRRDVGSGLCVRPVCLPIGQTHRPDPTFSQRLCVTALNSFNSKGKI